MTQRGIAALSMCLALVYLPQTAIASDWACINPSGAVCTHYYDRENVEYQDSGNLVRVRLKVMVDEGIIKQTLTERSENGYLIEGWDKWSHTVYLDEFACKQKAYRTLSDVDYDSNGNVLEQSEYQDKRWSVIPPDTVENRLYGIVCSLKEDKKGKTEK